MGYDAVMSDVVVIGAGPAGWAAAAACREAGLAVTLVAPEPRGAWPANYGAWEDELAEVGALGCVARRFASPRVFLDGHAPVSLARTYCQVDKQALRRWLVGRAEGTEELAGTVLGVEHDAEGSTLQLTAGTLRARVVVDASGHRPVLVERSAEPTAAQVAWGVLAHVEGWTDEQAWLMDFRAVDDGPPTFLYALPQGDGRVFLEETTLAARPPLSLAALEARLQLRLSRLGLTLGPVEEVERCFIPMDAPMPSLDQRVVGLGGAASLVQPASGYLLATTLRTAPALASALAAQADPVAAARAGWQAVWPAERRRQWAVYRFGLEILLGLDLPATTDFFAAFFQLPAEQWGGFLSGTLPPARQAEVMWTMMVRADPGTRRRLLISGLTPPGLRAMAALAGWS